MGKKADQPQLPFDPQFEKWERGERAQRRQLDAPLDRLRQRLAERQAAAATEAPEDPAPDEDQDVGEQLDEDDGEPVPC